MNYITMIFSPTGGTQKAAAALTAAWGEPARSVDLTDAKEDFSRIALRPDDTAVIAVPSYGGRVPGLAAERIRRIQGNGANAILVCVYGNRAYEDTLVEMEDLAKASGFRVTAAVAAVAEHSIVRKIAAGRPDAEDQKILEGFGETIRERLQNGGMAGKIPGGRPYKKTGGGMVPQTDGRCIQCGQCAAQCPAGAIDPADAGKIDAEKCIFCMRCVENCSQRAKTMDAAKLAGIEAMLEKACPDRKPCELF